MYLIIHLYMLLIRYNKIINNCLKYVKIEHKQYNKNNNKLLNRHRIKKK